LANRLSSRDRQNLIEIHVNPVGRLIPVRLA
jgi:hypothetical protein